MDKYWKVVVRYGHVGKRNEVSVARYLRTEEHCSVIDVMILVSEMPGVKANGVISVRQKMKKAIIWGRKWRNKISTYRN